MKKQFVVGISFFILLIIILVISLKKGDSKNAVTCDESGYYSIGDSVDPGRLMSVILPTTNFEGPMGYTLNKPSDQPLTSPPSVDYSVYSSLGALDKCKLDVNCRGVQFARYNSQDVNYKLSAPDKDGPPTPGFTSDPSSNIYLSNLLAYYQYLNQLDPSYNLQENKFNTSVFKNTGLVLVDRVVNNAGSDYPNNLLSKVNLTDGINNCENDPNCYALVCKQYSHSDGTTDCVKKSSNTKVDKSAPNSKSWMTYIPKKVFSSNNNVLIN